MGDRDEDFAAYMSARWAALVRSAVLLGCTPHQAEDLAQTALERCYVSWPRLGNVVNRDAYVYRVLVNCQRDSRRRRWWGERPTEQLPETLDTADPVTGVDVTDAVRRALGALSPAYRAVVVLRFFAHLSERETAEALGIAVGTVKSRTSRAMSLLAGNTHLADLTDGNAS